MAALEILGLVTLAKLAAVRAEPADFATALALAFAGCAGAPCVRVIAPLAGQAQLHQVALALKAVQVRVVSLVHRHYGLTVAQRVAALAKYVRAPA